MFHGVHEAVFHLWEAGFKLFVTCVSTWRTKSWHNAQFGQKARAQGCPQTIAIALSTLISCAIYFCKIIVELQSFECNMRYLLMKISVLRYLLSKNCYLFWNFGTPLPGHIHSTKQHDYCMVYMHLACNIMRTSHDTQYLLFRGRTINNSNVLLVKSSARCFRRLRRHSSNCAELCVIGCCLDRSVIDRHQLDRAQSWVFCEETSACRRCRSCRSYRQLAPISSSCCLLQGNSFSRSSAVIAGIYSLICSCRRGRRTTHKFVTTFLIFPCHVLTQLINHSKYPYISGHSF